MKLFVVNKKDFDIAFQEEAKECHKEAYNLLLKSISVEEVIPIYINIDNCTFELNKFSRRDDIYFYEALF